MLHRAYDTSALAGTPVTNMNAARQPLGPLDTNAPSFVNNRAGLAGVGLTSGIRLSQANSTPGLDVLTRHH